jgi:hypothetical protein
MRRLFTVICILTFVLYSSIANAKQQPEEKDISDVFITTLYPYIYQAVTKYFGYPQSFDLYDAKIIEITRPKKQEQFTFEVKVQVNTFVQAHNPPNTIETITLAVNLFGINVINYEHKSDEWERKIRKFKADILTDITETFNLDMKSYQQYEYQQLAYLSDNQEKFKSLLNLNNQIWSKSNIGVGFVNVVAPVTFIKNNHGYILFKEADGTNLLYTIQNQNEEWKILKIETKKGKIMPKKLMWYMV